MLHIAPSRPKMLTSPVGIGAETSRSTTQEGQPLPHASLSVTKVLLCVGRNSYSRDKSGTSRVREGPREVVT